MASVEEKKGGHPVTADISMATEFDVAIVADTVVPASIFRPEYLEGLRLLSGACEEIVSRGFARPILVGGAAVEFHTGGRVMTGDFDFVTPQGEIFEDVLPRYGFIADEKRQGLMKSFRHPALDIAAEVLSDKLYPGSDIALVRLFDITDGKRIAIYPIEDLIADRLGQYAEDNSRAEMLGQAIIMYDLAYERDEAYLDKRIREQTAGDWTLTHLKEAAHGRDEA